MRKKKARVEPLRESEAFTIENQENNGVELPTIISYFRECSDSHAHDRLITEMKINFYDKLNIDEFSEDFFNACRFILSIDDRTRTDVPFKFVVQFALCCINKATDDISKSKAMKLMTRLMKFLTWHHDATFPHVRFNVVKGLRILLNDLTEDIEMPESFYEPIQDALLKRFWDVKIYTRAEAAQASSRLQNPSNADCAIVISLIHLCKFDSSHTVRLAAMQALAITTKTLPVIITRCRDLNDIVRKKAFEILIKWKILKPLTVSKRLQIMETGLNDHSEAVRAVTKELLMIWFQLSGNDPVALLKRLDVENMEESTELILVTLLRQLNETELAALVDFLVDKMDENLLIKEEHLCAEMSFFWKHLVEFLQSKQSDLFEKIVPTVAYYEPYIRRQIEKQMAQVNDREVNLDECVESYTIIKHLLPIVKNMDDLADEVSRQRMISMIRWALASPSVPYNYVEHLMKLMAHLETDGEKMCNIVVELIDNLIFSEADAADEISEQTVQSLHEPPPTQPDVPAPVVHRENNRRIAVEIASLDVEINILRESINEVLRNNTEIEVQELAMKLGELKKQKADLEKLLNPPSLLNDGAPAVAANPNVINVEEDECELDQVKAELKDHSPLMEPGMEHKVIKANVMTIAMIQECKMLWTLPNTLRALFDKVIRPSIQHSILCVREKALLAMGLCLWLDKDLAIQYFNVLIEATKIDLDSIKEISVKSLIDIFIRFGIEPFQESMIAKTRSMLNTTKIEESHPTIKSESSCITDATGMTEDEYNKCTTELMSPIIDLLNSETPSLRSSVAIGLTKLFFNNKLMSSKLLSRLLLLWFSPETDDNNYLGQYLGAFFSNYTLMSADNQESIMNCFLITMRSLCRAPANSPLTDIDINNVISFFERVTDSHYLVENRTKPAEEQTELVNPCHDNLAIILSNQILNLPLSQEVKYYIPMLMRLRLSPNNVELIHKLEPMVEIMIKKIKEKKLVQTLQDFHRKLLHRLEDEIASIEQANSLADEDRSVDMDINLSRPSLLELGSDGQKMNQTYLRVNQTVNVNDTVSQISSICLRDSSQLDSTLTEEQPQSSSVAAESDVTSMLGSSSTVNKNDVFKKPANPLRTKQNSRTETPRRVTRQFKANNESLDSSSISSSSSTSSRITRSSSQKRK